MNTDLLTIERIANWLKQYATYTLPQDPENERLRRIFIKRGMRRILKGSKFQATFTDKPDILQVVITKPLTNVLIETST